MLVSQKNILGWQALLLTKLLPRMTAIVIKIERRLSHHTMASVMPPANCDGKLVFIVVLFS